MLAPCGRKLFLESVMLGSKLDPITLPSTSPSMNQLVLRQNNADPEAKWIVQKYGGTSVGKFAVNIARDIVP